MSSYKVRLTNKFLDSRFNDGNPGKELGLQLEVLRLGLDDPSITTGPGRELWWQRTPRFLEYELIGD